MKHSGKARQAAQKFVRWSFSVMVAALVGLYLARPHFVLYQVVGETAFGLAGIFLVFTLYFFRDPDARVPAGPGLVVSPGHGTVDVIDETTEAEFLGGRCRRISIFLSVFNVHVQNAPVAGTVKYLKHRPGKFLNALKTESAAENENVLIGFETANPAGKVGVRLIAGLIARRIIPWVAEGDTPARGERISLIQFGSRVDVYLPPETTVAVKLGDKVVGGETVLATLATGL